MSLILVGLGANAQAPALGWESVYEWPTTNICYGANRTSDGGYIMTGNTGADDSGMPLGNADMNFFIAKADADGNYQWAKSYGGSGADLAQNAVQTPDGGYVVCGITYSNDGDITGGYEAADFWILKLDASGVLQWQKSLGGNSEDDPYSIALTSDGGYIVGGLTLSVDGDVTGLHGNGNLPDAWVVKLTAAGDIQWQKTFGGTWNEAVLSIIQTTDGGYIFTGGAISSNGDVAVNHGGEDVWVVKLNASGVIEWEKTYGGTADEQGSAIIEVQDGYIVASNTVSNNGQVTGNHGNFDYWLIKISTTGELVWQKTYGGSGIDHCYNVSAIENGYLLSGYSMSNNGDVSAALGGADSWIVRVDEQGVILWEKSLGSANDDDRAVNAFQSADGTFTIAGHKGFPFTDRGSDFYMAKLGEETMSRDAVNKAVSVYPNPVSSVLNVSSSNYVTDVAVFDMQAREVMKLNEISKMALQVDMSQLSPNIYLVEVSTLSQKQAFKIIVE